MGMQLPSSSLGSIPWLSELGMDDSFFSRNLDCLLSGSHEAAMSMSTIMGPECSSTTGSGNLGTGEITLPTKEPKKRHVATKVDRDHSSASMYLPDDTTYLGRFSKLPKLEPWAIPCDEQGDINKPRLPQPQACISVSNQLVSPQEMHLLKGFRASHHVRSKETMTPIASTVLDFHLKGGRSHSPKSSITSDMHSSAVSTATKGMSRSPSDSFGGLISSNRDVMGARDSPVLQKPGSDHIMAERRRREKLSQRFIALSAIVPGLKKMDKATILGDAIKYVRQMQNRLKILEEQAPKVVCIARSNSCTDASGSNVEDEMQVQQQPEIEVRMAQRNVLVRVHCEKRKNLLVKMLAELEQLHLSVINANVLTFTEATHDLTLTAQVEEDVEITTDSIVKALHTFFKKQK